MPEASNLNVTRGVTRADAVVATNGAGGARIRDNSGSVHVLADLVGVFRIWQG